MTKPHRGRIQAQGENLEESVTWAQDEPLSKKDGLKLLELLKSKLSKKDLKKREQQFKQAQRFIENVKGGEDAPSDISFMNRKTKHERVDIEIWSGTAFGIFFVAFHYLVSNWVNMGQVLYATFLEDRRVYRLAKARWQRLFEQLLSAKQYTFRPFLNEKRMDGNPMFTAYVPAVDRALRIIQVDPSEAVAEVDIKAWLDQAVMPEREDRVEELVIDLVLTNEAEQISQLLIEAWLLQELSLTDMEKKIDELVVVDEEVGGV